MKSLRFSLARANFLRAAACAAAACLAAPASAQDHAVDAYPERPVRIIVPYGAGGAADLLARVLAERLAQGWGQPVIVENKPGGVGTIGISAVVKAAPDGYTLVSVPVSDLAVNPHLYRKRPFDIARDLAPVAQVGAVPNVLVVSNTLGVADAKALIAKAKAGRLSYSSPGIGSQAHLAAEIFAGRAGVNLLHVPYNSVSAALADVAGGQIDMMIAQLPAALPFIRGGRVKALGVVAEQRSPLVPEMPTLKETTGLSFGDAVSWSGLMAPAATPLALREKIARAVTQAMRSPQAQELLARQGTVGLGGTPDDLSKAIAEDSRRYGEVIKALDIRLD
ncbi:MAG: tripartite tricarboxylate transporter substrate binding protein [Burkholderiales bacterium]|nr:tripartite tricarboxylate transporter substrate binding protein [Burkholderiales bacterium]